MNRLRSQQTTEWMSYSASLAAVQSMRDKLTSGVNDRTLGLALFTAFYWEATAQRNDAWQKLYTSLRQNFSEQPAVELRLQLAMMLDELEQWLTGEPV
jgi:hypothetical protein